VKRLQFITAIPLSVELGSGCYVGIRTLMDGIRALGSEVALVTPKLRLPVFTLERILFNEMLRGGKFDGDATVGFDLDGYRLAGRGKAPHIAAIKGVLGDAVRFEAGFTRASMAFQTRLEKLHAQRADRVITVSRYCAARLDELYGVRNAIVVPELIDLDGWRRLFANNPAPRGHGRFTVLCVCRFYRRKRVDVLLRAAVQLKELIPELEIRIVGGGPEADRLQMLTRELRLDSIVEWVGNASPDHLAREYNRAHVFCLPSVQEGFGIVFLEAMAAGKPIVAARAAAVPEVVQHGLLAEPENAEALAQAILRLYSDSDLRMRLGAGGKVEVEKYEMMRVAARFLNQIP
jgi:glycosyltransferase involved in cell wall biosynthesis